MKRREFFAVIGGATIVGRGVGFAQQPRKARRIGVFIPFAQTDRIQNESFTVFKDRLRKLGWTEGREIEIVERWRPSADNATFQAVAADLVRQSPDLIFLVSTPVLAAVAAATKTIPIIFVGVSDPVGQGFVSNLAHPGENITGFTFFEPEMGGKWLGLLKEIAPSVERVTILFNPDTAPQTKLFLRSIDAAAKSFAITATAAPVRDESRVESIVKSIANEANGGLFLPSDTFTINHRALIIELAARYRVPALYAHDFFTRAGGLASYSVAVAEQFAQAADYADRIFNGAHPGDLPVQQPTKFDLTINLTAAKALGLTVPATLLARADEVIE
jgi:putative tryptophan/tyrosine transport system substrate-binding protein